MAQWVKRIKKGYYVIQYVTNTFTLQEDTTTYGQVIKAGELAVWETYLSEIPSNKNWYFEQEPNHNIIIEYS